jgi:hypothetical protein
LSSGERQRVLLARTLMNDPGVVLLDEPTAALDLAGREELVGTLDALAQDPATPPVVMVTHHVEEIPASFTHALLLRDGRALAQGPIDEVLTADALGACFGLPLRLERRDGRWLAWATQSAGATRTRPQRVPVAAVPPRRVGFVGGDEREEAFLGRVDLVAQESFDEGLPEAAAVVEVHDEAGAVVGGHHLDAQHPGGVLLPVVLIPLEHRGGRRLVAGADHPQALGTGQRTNAAPQVDAPRAVLFLGLRARHDREPVRISRQVIDPPEEGFRITRRIELGRDIHTARQYGDGRRLTTRAIRGGHRRRHRRRPRALRDVAPPRDVPMPSDSPRNDSGGAGDAVRAPPTGGS